LTLIYVEMSNATKIDSLSEACRDSSLIGEKRASVGDERVQEDGIHRLPEEIFDSLAHEFREVLLHHYYHTGMSDFIFISFAEDTPFSWIESISSQSAPTAVAVVHDVT
jgi:hypothetical protein